MCFRVLWKRPLRCLQRLRALEQAAVLEESGLHHPTLPAVLHDADMPARLTAYPPDGHAAALCLLRSHERVLIGRDPGCELRIDHPTVSRVHAELYSEGAHWRVRDLDSKNGCFINNEHIDSAELNGATWLRFGDVPCEFMPLSAAAFDSAEHWLSMRLAVSLQLSASASQLTSLPDLLQETLRAVVELADCERGFLLLAESDGLVVAASHDLDPMSLHSRKFNGSIGAVQRALGTLVPVVLNDVSADLELAGRPSVVVGGLRTLVCLPLIFGGEALGLVYADSRRKGAVITAPGLELLHTYAAEASRWIAARRGEATLASLVSHAVVDWKDILSAQQMVLREPTQRIDADPKATGSE